MSNSFTLAIRLQPRAARDEIVGERDGRLLVRVTQPPVEGRANDALCKLVAKRLGLPRRAVTLVRGDRSRDKLLEVNGIDAEVARRKLSP